MTPPQPPPPTTNHQTQGSAPPKPAEKRKTVTVEDVSEDESEKNTSPSSSSSSSSSLAASRGSGVSDEQKSRIVTLLKEQHKLKLKEAREIVGINKRQDEYQRGKLADKRMSDGASSAEDERQALLHSSDAKGSGTRGRRRRPPVRDYEHLDWHESTLYSLRSVTRKNRGRRGQKGTTPPTKH